MAWNYTRDESSSFETRIPEGKHRIRIKVADKTVSSTGNDMLTLKFEVSGYKGLIYHHIVFLQDRPEITNRNLTQFFDSFKDIPDGDFNTQHWIGKVGACVVKHEEWNGSVNAKVKSFIHANNQTDLPAWVEPPASDGSGSSSSSSSGSGNDFINVPDGLISELPF